MILTTTPCNFLVILSSLSMSSISFAISRGDTFASASGIFVFSFKEKEHLQEVRNVLFWTLLYLSCMIPYQSYIMFLLLFPNSAEAEFLFEFRYCIEQVQDVFYFFTWRSCGHFCNHQSLVHLCLCSLFRLTTTK